MNDTVLAKALPIPPFEIRQLVGLTDEAAYDNPRGTPVIPNIPLDCYESVFDFGCGCGRIARQLLQQTPRPKRYLGIDLHKGMIDWCQRNLAPPDRSFKFRHHDVFNAGFNPDARKPKFLDLPAEDHSFKLIVAWSVFTHTTQSQTEHYLREVARILSAGGVLVSTWFLFEKRYFPMMQDFQSALYINEYDLANATIFDREWLELTLSGLGLSIVRVVPPWIRGFQWEMQIAHTSSGRSQVCLPMDRAPFGRVPPPVPTGDVSGLRHLPVSSTPADDAANRVQNSLSAPANTETAHSKGFCSQLWKFISRLSVLSGQKFGRPF
jgi:SAM-dependent methyltransferase